MKRVASVVSLAFAVVMASIAANAATLTLGDASLSGDQLTVPVTVSGSSGGTLELYIGEAGPKDGNPSATLSAATLTISSDGEYNLSTQISVGAMIAYKAVLGSDESASGTITATDTSEYIWVNDAKGLWSDPNNWTRKNTSTDNYKNIGYPAYSTGFIRFNGGQTAEVTLDADYGRFGDLFIDNPNLNLTIYGNGHELRTGNVHTTGDNNFVFDNVRYITSGSYSVGSRSSTRLVNGTYFQTQWEFNVNGSGSTSLYVGPNCEINCGVGDGNAYAFRLDGEGNSIVIEDGYVHSRGLRIGQNRDGVPAGIVFKGNNPRLECYNEFVVCRSLSGNPVFEFYVPVGGYSQPPIKKTAGGNYIALGNKWINHTDSSSVYSPVAFIVNEHSPFYQSETSAEICLFDWSQSTYGIRDGSFVFMNEQATSPDNYLYAVKDNPSCETSQDQIWAHLTGTGIPSDLPTMESAVAASTDSSTASAAFTATITSFSNADYDTTLELWLAAGGPKDTPETSLVKVETKNVNAAGNYTFDYFGALGSKIAYKVILKASNGIKEWICEETAISTVVLLDNHSRQYKWIGGESGTWSDASCWELEGNEDGISRIGYPTWGSDAAFYGITTEVTVDADYANIHQIILGWGGANLTFKTDEPGTVRTIETGNLKDGQYENVKVALDGVAFDTLGNTYIGNYSIKRNSSLVMTNGARLRTRWRVYVEGENAYLYVGTNCAVYVSKAENWHWIELSGKDAEIVIDGGLIDSLCLWIGQQYVDATPKGITFSGSNPRLVLGDNNGERKTQVRNAIPGSPVFNFVIPEGGFESTPIVRSQGGGATLFEQTSEDIPAVTFKVDRSSPYLKVRGNFTQQLVDWSTSTAETKLNIDGVAFAAMPREGETMYFTPVQGETKSGIAVSCLGPSGFAIIFR